MRNILVFLISVSVFLLPGKSYGLSINQHIGFLWGQGEEIAYNEYWTSSNNENIFLSQLLWDLKPLVYIGLDLEFGPPVPWVNNGFKAGLSLKYGLPLSSGILEDRDWLASNDSFLTNYSRHDASSDLSTLIAEVSLGYSWVISPVAWVKVSGELSYLRLSWISKDGYIQYGTNDPGKYRTGYAYVPWNPGWDKDPYMGPAINYVQNWFSIAPALTLGMKLPGNFTFVLLSALTPFNFGYCVDDHLNPENRNTFVDYPFWGFSIREEMTMNFLMSKKIELGLTAAFRYLGNTRGDSFASTTGGSYTYSGHVGGGGYKFFDFSFFWKYAF